MGHAGPDSADDGESPGSRRGWGLILRRLEHRAFTQRKRRQRCVKAQKLSVESRRSRGSKRRKQVLNWCVRIADLELGDPLASFGTVNNPHVEPPADAVEATRTPTLQTVSSALTPA